VAKRIGILGGISAESTAAYYNRIIRGYYERCRDDYYPEIVIFSLSFQRFTDLENRGDEAAYLAEILGGIRALEAAGVAFVLMAANSPHAVFDQVEASARVPVLSIVEVTARQASALGLRRLLLLGIKFTMQSSFYQETCAKLGIEVLTPTGPEQDEIDRIIFDELAHGLLRDESRVRVLEILAGYDVEGVILGCTELPLLLKQADAPVILLDTLDLHVRAALDVALADVKAASSEDLDGSATPWQSTT
jgi:aspartate racemase